MRAGYTHSVVQHAVLKDTPSGSAGFEAGITAGSQFSSFDWVFLWVLP